MTLNFGEAAARAAGEIRRKIPNPEEVRKALEAIEKVLGGMIKPSSSQNPAPSHSKGTPTNDAEVQRFKNETKTPKRQQRQLEKSVENGKSPSIGPQR